MAEKNKLTFPAFLLDDDMEELFDLVVSLDTSDTLKQSDTILMGLLVDALVTFHESNEKIKEEGAIVSIMGDRGNRDTKNPYISIKNEARTTILNICAQIGYSPKARTRLALEEAGIDSLSPFELLLKERKAKRDKK